MARQVEALILIQIYSGQHLLANTNILRLTFLADMNTNIFLNDYKYIRV